MAFAGLSRRAESHYFSCVRREIVLFFIWPIVVLYLLGQPIVGSIYFVSVGISLLRHYFNIVSVIEETGTMDLAPNKSRSKSWARQSRLTDIVDKISTDDSKRAWLTILGVLGLIFVFLLFSGILDADTSDTGDTTTLSKSLMSPFSALVSLHSIRIFS